MDRMAERSVALPPGRFDAVYGGWRNRPDRDGDRLRYGYHWEWDAVHDRWRRDYGYYDDSYAFGARDSYDPALDYGPHWEWDPLDLRWTRDHGFHVNDYGIGYGVARESGRDRSGRSSMDVDVSGTLESYRRIELEGQIRTGDIGNDLGRPQPGNTHRDQGLPDFDH